MDKNVLRLHQPNLTCAFDIIKTDDDVMWQLMMKNHEDCGISDEQFIQQVWLFANDWSVRLVQNGQFDISKWTKGLPPVSVIIAHNKKYSIFTVNFAGETEPITPSLFAIYLGEFCKNQSKELGIKLQGLNNDGTKA